MFNYFFCFYFSWLLQLAIHNLKKSANVNELSFKNLQILHKKPPKICNNMLIFVAIKHLYSYIETQIYGLPKAMEGDQEK